MKGKNYRSVTFRPIRNQSSLTLSGILFTRSLYPTRVHPPLDSCILFLYFSLILSLDLAPASSSSRAGARRREIRPRKGTKGGDKGKRRPRDTRTMDAEQWAAAGNSTDDGKRPLLERTTFQRTRFIEFSSVPLVKLITSELTDASRGCN